MRRRSAILPLSLALTLACASLVPPASAQTETSAEEHSKRGVELYAEGKLPEAVAEMLKAHELAPEPGLLYNIARIYQKMGQFDLAAHYFKKFVTLDGADPDRVQKALQHLEELKKAPPSTPSSEPLPPAPVAPTPTVSATTSPPPDEGSDDLLAWSLIGVGGGAIVVGAVLGGLALGASGDLDDPGVSYADKQTAQVSARDHALGADISIAVGVAAAGAGFLLMLLTGDEEGSTAAVTPTVGPGHAGAQLLVRFP